MGSSNHTSSDEGVSPAVCRRGRTRATYVHVSAADCQTSTTHARFTRFTSPTAIGHTRRFLRDQEECNVPDCDEVPVVDDTNCKKVISLGNEPCPKRDARTLLVFLPGLQSGRLAPLAEGLTYHKNADSRMTTTIV